MTSEGVPASQYRSNKQAAPQITGVLVSNLQGKKESSDSLATSSDVCGKSRPGRNLLFLKRGVNQHPLSCYIFYFFIRIEDVQGVVYLEHWD